MFPHLKVIPGKMKNVLLSRPAAFLFVFGFMLTVSVHAQSTFTFEKVDFPGATSTQATGINDVGDIVGTYTMSGLSHGFLLSGGIYNSIKDCPGATLTLPSGINNAGVIIGSCDFDASLYLHGFSLSDGNFTRIDFPGAIYTAATGINNTGQIIGIFYPSPSVGPFNFMLDGGNYGLLNLGFTSSINANVSSINDTREITGDYSASSGCPVHGFVSNAGSFSTIDFPGANVTATLGNNNVGQIVGYYALSCASNPLRHGFLLTGGSFSTIDFPEANGGIPGLTGTIASGINKAGRIVGTYVAGGAFHGFVTNTLGKLAAARAITLLSAPYGYDGKGYDFQLKRYVDANGPAPSIFADYNYYETCQMIGYSVTAAAKGVDCSGLVMWFYNTAAGATTQFAASPTYMNNNPMIYDKANNQYLYNTMEVNEADLRPGDLMFFDFDHDGIMDHVAMYLGGDEVIQAPQCGDVVKLSSKAALKTLSGFNACGPNNTSPCFRRVSKPIIKIEFIPRPDAPVSLAVTDPDGLTITANTISLTPREVLREVANVLYYNDADQVFSPVLKTGPYFIKAFPKPGTQPTDTFSLTATTAASTVTLAENLPLAAIPPLGYGIISTGSAILPFIPVAIDIKPGSSTNPINPASNGTIPVAILSNASFSAASAVDTSSLTFGRTGAQQSLAFCDGAAEDVNGDGLLDLVCHFHTEKTGFQAGDTGGILQGRTTSGQLIRGTDSVVIVP